MFHLHTRKAIRYLIWAMILLLAAVVCLGAGGVQAHPQTSVTIDPGTFHMVNVTLALAGDIHFNITVESGPPINVLILDQENCSLFLSNPLFFYAIWSLQSVNLLENMHTALLPAGDYFIVFDNSNLTQPWMEGPDAPAAVDFNVYGEVGEVSDPVALSSLITWSIDHVHLMWLAPWSDGGSPIIGYEIYRSPDAEGFPVLLGSDSRAYDDYNVTPGALEFYRVAARNAHGLSDSFDFQILIPFRGMVGPSPPQNVSVELNTREVVVSWYPPENAATEVIIQYRIEYVDLDKEGPREIQWFTASSYGDGGPLSIPLHCTYFNSNHNYSLRVVAMGVDGDSPPSNEVEFLTVFSPWSVTMDASWGDGWVELRWEPPFDDGGSPILSYLISKTTVRYSGYLVEDGAVPEFLGTENITLPYGVLTYYDTNVTNGLFYIYQISAVNAVSEGESTSNVVRPGTPSAPIGLTGMQMGAKVVLAWSAPLFDGGSPVSGYLLKISRWSYGSYGIDGYRNITMAGDLLYYEDTGVMPGYNYEYTLLPLNQLGGLGMYPAYCSVYVGSSGQRPDAPIDLTVELHSPDGTFYSMKLMINMTLVNPGAATYCRVYYYNEAEQFTRTINLAVDYSGPRQCFSLDIYWLGLEGGTPYHFYASVINDVGEGPYTEEFVTTLYLPPSQPLDVVADWGASDATINWQAPESDGGSPILGYRLTRWHVSDSDYTYSYWMNMTLGPEARSFHDTSIPAGISMDYQICAFSAIGDGRLSAVRVLTGSPYAVRNLTLENGDGYVLLAWDPPASDGGSAIQGYRLSWYDNTDYVSGDATIPLGQNSYNHTAINGHTYSYWIKAYNRVGNGPDYLETMIGQPAAPPPGIINLLARWYDDGSGNVSVLLTWELNGNGDGCEFSIRKSGGMFAMMSLSAPGSDHTFVDTMVTANETFTYQVRAKANGAFGPGSSVSITPRCALDVPQAVFAVPGVGYVNLSWAAPSVCPENASGYLLFRGEGSGALVLLVTLPAGTLHYNDTSVRLGTNYTYRLGVAGSDSGNMSAPVKVKAGGLLAASSGTTTAGFTWPLLIVLIVGAVICLVVWIYTPWKKKLKIISTVVVMGAAAAIVIAGAMMPVPVSTAQSSSSEMIYHPGDYFVYGMYAPNGIGTVTATLLRVGDTTMTWNFSYSLPGQEPISEQQTMPKNHTEGYALALSNMTMGSMMGFMEVTSITNETLATQWGYITAERRHINSTMMGMDMAMDMWSSGEAILKMEWGMSMMSMEMRMVLIRLIDTNIPELIGGVR